MADRLTASPERPRHRFGLDIGATFTDFVLIDADAVLGNLDPDFFLGGRMALDPDVAKTAIDAAALVGHHTRVEIAASANLIATLFEA